jgi:hypothetical protein
LIPFCHPVLLIDSTSLAFDTNAVYAPLSSLCVCVCPSLLPSFLF